MSTTDRRLLRTSIYFCSDNWGTLISDALLPFLIANSSLFESYYLFFSNDRGDHLKILFKPVNRNKMRLAAAFSSEIKKFLHATPVTFLNDGFTPGKSIWMNYPANSLVINNFDTHFLSGSAELLRFSALTSILIVHKINKDKIENTEDIVGLAVELLLQLFGQTEEAFAINCLHSLVTKWGGDLETEFGPDTTLADTLAASAETAAVNRTALVYIANYYLNEEIAESPLQNWLSYVTTIIPHNTPDLATTSLLIDAFCYQLGLSELTKLYVLNLLLTFKMQPH